MSVELPILCFNDVYRVNQRYVAQPGAPSDPSSSSEQGQISVSQFGQLLLSERDKWATQPSGVEGSSQDVKEGLVLFAGDVFNPSTESSVTRGSHMVPIMNALKVDVACVGNHDFDFGYPHLTKLIKDTKFPWLLSNIIDGTTGQTPEPLHEYWMTERCGVKVGVIGLVEQDWIATIPSWPEHFQYRPMQETALELSRRLRDPNGPHNVDIIIALTHCRVPNDIKLANDLGAVASRAGLEKQHGVDLLIGGHDHIYYIGKGASSWDGYSGNHDAHGTENDAGVMLIKSGTDFRDLSSATLTLEPTPAGSIRKRLIRSLKGKHNYVLPSSPASSEIDDLLKTLLSSVSDTLSKPVCFTLTPFDARSELVRTQETGLGNWVADVLMHAYAESLMEGRDDVVEKVDHKELADREHSLEEDANRKGMELKGGADAVIICGGTLRGDSQYGPGKITLGDILEIFPFEDPVVCIEIDGKGIWDTLESALSKWPAQEGRFPIVSGLEVEWDHTKPPGSRVKSIHLIVPVQKEDVDDPEDLIDFVEQQDGTRVEVKQRPPQRGEEIKNESGGRIYRVITREYMAQGYDGFTALKNRPFLVDDETGLMISSIVRSFLLGSSYIFRHKQFRESHEAHLSSRTKVVLDKARREHHSPSNSPTSSPRTTHSKLNLTSPPVSPYSGMREPNPWDSPASTETGNGRRHVVNHSWAAIRDAMHIAKHEHLSEVDCLQGQQMRCPPVKQAPLLSVKRPDLQTPQKATHAREGNNQGAPSLFVDATKKEELQALSDDLAIVCPLIDGRLRDVAAK